MEGLTVPERCYQSYAITTAGRLSEAAVLYWIWKGVDSINISLTHIMANHSISSIVIYTER